MQLLIIVILLQEWASGILAQNKKNFLDYCSANMKDVSLLDSFQIVMMAHYLEETLRLCMVEVIIGQQKQAW